MLSHPLRTSPSRSTLVRALKTASRSDKHYLLVPRGKESTLTATIRENASTIMSKASTLTTEPSNAAAVDGDGDGNGHVCVELEKEAQCKVSLELLWSWKRSIARKPFAVIISISTIVHGMYSPRPRAHKLLARASPELCECIWQPLLHPNFARTYRSHGGWHYFVFRCRRHPNAHSNCNFG